MNDKFITRGAIKNRVLMLVMAVILFVYGIYTYIILPKQEYPVVDSPAVIITVVYPGASAEEIENLVTTKIEDAVMKANGFDKIETVCTENVSQSTVFFGLDLDTDILNSSINNLREDIFALEGTVLPDGVSNIYFSTDVTDTSGMIISMTSSERSNGELVQRMNELKDQLRHVSGVKNVKVEGGFDNQIEVLVDYNKLNNLSITLTEITQIIDYNNSLIPIGDIEYSNDKIKIKSDSNISSVDEIGNIIININEDGIITKLKDIAEISLSTDDNQKTYFFNGESAVILDLYYKTGIDITKTEKEIQKVINKFEETLPSDIDLNIAINLADDVRNSVSSFTINLIQSVLIVLVVVMIGMSFKNGIIVAVAIPLSISIPFIGMQLFGLEIQFVSLAALIIALGMLVDNAIVVCDSIQLYLNRGMERVDACVKGTKIVAFPVLTSTLTTVVMFAIFLGLPGTMLKFSISLPLVVITALVASYAVSMLITPIMCFYFMKVEENHEEKDSLINKLRNILMNMVDHAFKHKTITMAIAVAALVAAVVGMLNTSMTFMPKSEKLIVDIKVESGTNTDIRKTKEMVERVTEIVAEQPETEFYLTTIGGVAPKYDFSSMPKADNLNLGGLVVRVDMSDSKQTKSEFVENLQNTLNTEVGGDITVTELAVVNSPGTEQIQVRLTGKDIEVLNQYGEEIGAMLTDIEGARNVRVTDQIGNYTYFADYREDTLNSYGITKIEVSNELNIAIMGRESTVYRENTLEYPVVIKSNIDSIPSLENYKVKSSATNEKYAINQIADIYLKENVDKIARFNGERTVVISAIPLNGYSALDIQSELKRKVEKMGLTDVTVIYEGDNATMMDAIEKIASGAIIGVIVILIILYIQFKSFKTAFIILASIPFCLIGAILGIHLFNAAFDFYTILGIVSLIGVVVNNAIVLVDFIENERQDMDLDSACKEAVKARFRPVMLSTTTSVLGMIPLAIGGSILFRGLAIAFMCGLTVSMCFTFIVIPIIYSVACKEKTVEVI